MENNEMSKEAKNFIGALKMLAHREVRKEAETEIDEDTRLLYELWHREILAACTKIYTKSKIREVKKELLESAKKQIILLNERKIKGFDLFLNDVSLEEERKIQNIKNRIKYIEGLSEEQLVEEIIKSLCGSSDYIETIINRKEQMEQEKLKKLSYRGKKVVEDNKINNETAKRIFEEIKEKELNQISERVAETLNTNEQFVSLRETENNAKNIIIYEVAKIYRDKIAKIRMEIQQELEKLSSKYKSFANTDDLNLVRIKASLENDVAKTGFLISKKKKEKYKELISVIEGTLQHEKDLQEYAARIQDFGMTDRMKNVFDETEVKNEIREHRIAIMNRTGIIIDKISDQTIELEAAQLKKEVKAKAKAINDSVTTVCTVEEKEKIEEFANTIGLSVKEAIKFISNDNSMYSCLYAHIFGNEVLSKINDENAEEYLGMLNKQAQYEKNRIGEIAEKAYMLDIQKKHTQKENTKPQIAAKQYQKKIPYKK